MEHFKIAFLDHVAIRVRDLEASAQWYETVLGLRRCQPPEWKPFPIFLLAGKTGIALFPADTSLPQPDPLARHVKIDHFAFHVSMENLLKAEARYRELGLESKVQDHHYFRSLYTRDPDGHTVELTALAVKAVDFYPTQ